MTVGGRVTEGKITAGVKVRLKRKGQMVDEGTVSKCQVGQQVMSEVPAGTECGVRFEGKEKIEEGDILEFYREDSKVKKLVFEK